MSRPVKGDHEQLACWIPAATMQRLEAYLQDKQASKRDIVTLALEAFLSAPATAQLAAEVGKKLKEAQCDPSTSSPSRSSSSA